MPMSWEEFRKYASQFTEVSDKLNDGWTRMEYEVLYIQIFHSRPIICYKFIYFVRKHLYVILRNVMKGGTFVACVCILIQTKFVLGVKLKYYQKFLNI